MRDALLPGEADVYQLIGCQNPCLSPDLFIQMTRNGRRGCKLAAIGDADKLSLELFFVSRFIMGLWAYSKRNIIPLNKVMNLLSQQLNS